MEFLFYCLGKCSFGMEIMFLSHNDYNKALAQVAEMKNVPRLMPVALIDVL